MELLGALENSGFGIWVRESGSLWSYPTIIFLHSLGLSFVVGLSVALDLRLLGCAPRLPLPAFKRLFPIMWFGFWINTLSGIALLIADASTMAVNPVFYVKMACIVGAVAIMVAIRRQVLALGRQEALSANEQVSNRVTMRRRVAGGGVVAETVDIVSPSPLDTPSPVPTRARLLAVLSLLLWAGAITAGRLTAYLGPVAGLKGR
jgi:hypothetical protein